MSEEADKKDEIAETPDEQVSRTAHKLTMPDETIFYEAITGTLLLREEDEKAGHKPKASVFYTYYKKLENNGEIRPITYCFNGGPGSSSVWLHLGLFGPRRVLMDDEGNALPPPYKLVENNFSLLDVTDLVFIDPVSTGYSRAVPGEKANQYHEFKKDIASLAEFIRLFTSRYERWSSPKFIAGESYGTTRAAELSGVLLESHGMALNGILLISSILDFQTVLFSPTNDLAPILILPTYAATAFYHNRLEPDLQDDLVALMDEVRAFAEGEYASALMQGDRISAETEANIVAKLVRYTGLSAEYIRGSNLRINIQRFTKELLRDQRRTVGRLDSRFTGIDRDAVGATGEYDPSYTNIQATYTATFNDYVRNKLEHKTDLPYEILTFNVYPWSYKAFENRYVDVADTLRGAMSRNPAMKIFVANGYYDMATPFFATEYTFSHLNLDPELRDNITMTYYEAGHMMYVQLAALEQLKHDMTAFVVDALS